MGFREFITNRLFRKRLQASLDQVQNIRPPANPSRRYIDKLVKRLLSDQHAELAQRELELIGSAAVPALAAALRDPRYHQRIERSHFLIDQPLDILLGLLVPLASDEVVSAAAQLVHSTSSEIRKTAALHLASLGRNDVVPYLAELLQDEDGYVRSYTAMGVRRATSAERAEKDFRSRMYDLLLAQCDLEWDEAENDAASAVIELDPIRAAVDLASDRCLVPSNRNLYTILDECNRAVLVLSESPLRRLLDHSIPRAVGEQSYRHQRVVAGALVALARCAGERARPRLEQCLTSDQTKIQEAAGQGLAILAGLDDPVAFVLERDQETGFEGLTAPQRVVYCGFLFDAEVRNGGLMQFFGNSSGDHSVETLEALRVLCHADAVNALETAMKLVGPLSREPDRDMRLEAFGDRYEELQAAFAPLEQAYYQSKVSLQKRMLLHAVEHAKHFRRSSLASP